MYYPQTRQTAPPTALPLSLAEAWVACRLGELDEATTDPFALAEIGFVRGLIQAAARWWELSVDGPLMEAEYVTVLRGFDAELKGLYGPITQVLSLTYATDEDVNTVGAHADYAVSEGRSGVLLYTGSDSFPALRRGYAEPLRVRYRAGYTTPEQVDPLIKQAIALTVGHWYENRQNVVVGNQANEVPGTAQDIVRLFRSPVL